MTLWRAEYCKECLHDTEITIDKQCSGFTRNPQNQTSSKCTKCSHDESTHREMEPLKVIREQEHRISHLERRVEKLKKNQQVIEQQQMQIFQLEKMMKQLEIEMKKISLTQNSISPPMRSKTPASHHSHSSSFDSHSSGLSSLNSSNSLEDSLLIHKSDISLIRDWCKGSFSLLYRASLNGFSAKRFHEKCDKKGATLTVVRDSEGNIFGGCTSVSWSSPGGGGDWKADLKAWIFTLKNIHKPNSQPTVFRVTEKTSSKAIYCSSIYGPIFGEGFDLKIDGEKKKAVANQCIFKTYKNTTNEPYPLTGTNSFILDDYEVWQITQ